jgi:purine-binding chemotaxis protein CheW
MKVANRSNITHKKSALHSADLMPSDVAAVAILRKRKDYFANQIITPDKIEDHVLYIKCRLGDLDFYGIPNLAAKEVLQSNYITAVPAAPAYIAGVFNYRGSLIAIINLKHFFHLNDKQEIVHENQSIVITATPDLTVGILVDAIEGSDAYKPSTLTLPISSSSAIKPEYIIGLHHGKTTIINITKVLNDIKGERHE